MPTNNDPLLQILTELYGQPAGSETHRSLLELIRRWSGLLKQQNKPAASAGLTQKDAILITYGDQVQEPGVPPLRSLAGFCEAHLKDIIPAIHILPFYPYSSDDGFSVIDYRQVDPALGAWEDITRLGRSFRLMFDAVINHASVQSSWFQGFLNGDPKYQGYFITVEGEPDLSQVVRPRALPLLTAFQTSSGPKRVWTTFSADQVDLNYRDPHLLLEIIDILLFYVSKGAAFIRLDAIAYLWKEIGTRCIHLPQTHRIIQLIRLVLDRIAPEVYLITETNVPHVENISYFGQDGSEAQLVYNFALPPLVLHTLLTGDASALTRWASELYLPSPKVTFFNFLASHDGIGLNPARGILQEDEIEALVQRTVEHGGLVSYKSNPDGTQSPYELNISYFDALSHPKAAEAIEVQIDRMIAAHAIMLAVTGVPGIYFHSLFGSRSWREGVDLTGRSRTINRQKLQRADLERELSQPQSLRSRVFNRLSRLISVRGSHPAFHPYSPQSVIELNRGVFALVRTSPEQGDKVLCLQNVTARPLRLVLDPGHVSLSPVITELISARQFDLSKERELQLEPYQTLWLAGKAAETPA